MSSKKQKKNKKNQNKQTAAPKCDLKFTVKKEKGSFKWNPLRKRVEEEFFELLDTHEFTLRKLIFSGEIIKLHEAIKPYIEFAEKEPYFIPIYREIGYNFFVAEDFQSALYFLEQGLAIATQLIPPSFSGIIRDKGLFNDAYFATGQMTAEIFLFLKDYQKALHVIIQTYFLREFVDDKLIALYITILIHNGLLFDALKEITQFTDNDFSPELKYLYAWLLFKIGNKTGAQEQLNIAVAKAPLIAKALLVENPGEDEAVEENDDENGTVDLINQITSEEFPFREKGEFSRFFVKQLRHIEAKMFARIHYPFWVEVELQEALRKALKLDV